MAEGQNDSSSIDATLIAGGSRNDRHVLATRHGAVVDLSTTLCDVPNRCVTNRHVLGKTQAGTYGITSNHEDLFGLEHGQFPWVSIALWPAVKRIIEQQGYTVIDRVGQPLCLESPTALDSNRFLETDMGLIDLVQHQERGIVRIGDNVDPAYLTAQVAASWPDLSIAVALKRIDDVKGLARRLRRWIPRVKSIQAANDDLSVERAKVVVGTFEACACNINVGVSSRNILIFPNAIEALGVEATRVADSARIARQYAFLPLGEHIAPRDQDQLRDKFGFEEVLIPRHGYRLRGVEVIWMRMTGGPQLAPRADIVDVKRQCVWNNHARNRRIASLARALTCKDNETLQQKFPPVAAAIAGSDQRPRVAILVEGSEHAEVLAKHFTGLASCRPLRI